MKEILTELDFLRIFRDRASISEIKFLLSKFRKLPRGSNGTIKSPKMLRQVRTPT